MNKKSGFTIVELIIVIVVIGILAAIAIIGYTDMQNRAIIARRTQHLNSLAKAAEIQILREDGNPMTDIFWKNALIKSSLIESARARSNGASVNDHDTFAFCAKDGKYVIATVMPKVINKTVFLVYQSGTIKNIKEDEIPSGAGGNSGLTIDVICDITGLNGGYKNWGHTQHILNAT